MTSKLIGSEFAPTGYGNVAAKYDGFAVSYHGEEHPLGIPSFRADSPDGETALIVGDDYYILNGDWRMAYSELAPSGLDACLDFFRRKAPQFKSSWSDTPSD